MWHAKVRGGYSRDTQEALDNARMMAAVMRTQGWSLKAIAAMLGNGAGESGLNPWRWESDDVPTYSEYQSWSSEEARSHGYGLFGFTPASKYIEGGKSYEGYAPNFSDRAGNASDGAAQTSYFSATVGSSWSHSNYSYYADDFAEIGVDINDFYYISFDEFKAGGSSIANLTGAFCLCYEKPADWAAASSYTTRVNNANYWYNKLGALVWTRNTLPVSSADEPHPYYNTRSSGRGVSSCIEGHFSDWYWSNYHLDVLQNCVGCAIGCFNETYVMNSTSATWRDWPYPIPGNGDRIVEGAQSIGLPTLSPSAQAPIGGLISWEPIHVAFIVGVEYGNADGSPSPNDVIITMESGYQDSATSPDTITSDVIGSENFDNYNVSPGDNWGWRRDRRRRGNNNLWGYGTRCKGFVINPAIGTKVIQLENIDHSDTFVPTGFAPEITSILSVSSTRITVTGTANSEDNSEVRLYIKWDSGNVSQSDYDTIVTTRGDFSVNVTKPRRAASVAILPVRTEDGTEGSIYIATGLIVAIPCINIYVNGSMKQSIPYVRTGNRWRETLPVLRTNNEWKEIWNVKE